MAALPNSYFDSYADPTPGNSDLSYAKNWKKYGFQLFERYLEELSEKNIPQPGSVLDIGAANGAVLNELQRLGFEARGIESSEYIYNQTPAELKKFIALGDACDLVTKMSEDSFDAVYETAAQYIPKDKLKQYLKDLFKIVRRDLVIVLHTVDFDPKPHQNQVNHLSNESWRSLLSEAGFEECGDLEESPYWFKKPGASTVASLVESQHHLRHLSPKEKLQVCSIQLDEAADALHEAERLIEKNGHDVSPEFVKDYTKSIKSAGDLILGMQRHAKAFREDQSKTSAELLVETGRNVDNILAHAIGMLNSMKTVSKWLDSSRRRVLVAAENVNDLLKCAQELA